MDTWIVTGATGLLGSNIADTLKNRFRLVGISRTQPPSGLFDVHHAIDVRDDRSVRQVLKTEGATGMIHTAALANPEACTADPELARILNAQVPGQLARLAHDYDARFIHISTDAVFSGREGGYTETDLPQPFSLYGETKLAGEREVAHANPDALIVRTNFFGWSLAGNRSILEFFVTSLRRGQGVYGFPITGFHRSTHET